MNHTFFDHEQYTVERDPHKSNNEDSYKNKV